MLVQTVVVRGYKIVMRASTAPVRGFIIVMRASTTLVRGYTIVVRVPTTLVRGFTIVVRASTPPVRGCLMVCNVQAEVVLPYCFEISFPYYCAIFIHSRKEDIGTIGKQQKSIGLPYGHREHAVNRQCPRLCWCELTAFVCSR